MFWPDFPVPVGVLRRVERPTHDQLVPGQIDEARAQQGEGDLRELLFTQRHLDHRLSRGVVVVADDLMWSTRLAEAVAAGRRPARGPRQRRGAGHGPRGARGGRPGHRSGGAIVDLAGRRYDGVAAIGAPARGAPAGHRRGPARRPGDAPARAGGRRQRVFSYNKFFSDGPRLVDGWLAGRPRRRTGRRRMSATIAPARYAERLAARPGGRRPRAGLAATARRRRPGAGVADRLCGHRPRAAEPAGRPARCGRPTFVGPRLEAAAAEQAPGAGRGDACGS